MTADDLKAQLEAACDDLWWSSESDYPVEMVWIPATEVPTEAIEASAVRKLFSRAEDAAIEVISIEAFFERATAPKSWHTEADKVQMNRLQALKALLTDSLSNLQVYRWGEVEIRVYVLGNAPDSAIAGVKTTLVET